MTKLEELRAALEAATPGRWAYDDDGFVYGDMDGTQPNSGGYIVSDPHSSPEADIDEREGNAEFITLAHNLMPTLLKVVELLPALIDYAENATLEDDEMPDCVVEANALLEKLK